MASNFLRLCKTAKTAKLSHFQILEMSQNRIPKDIFAITLFIVLKDVNFGKI